jgi:chromosome segregation ATPase
MIIDYDKDQLSYALANALRERDEARKELSLKQQTLTIAEGTLSDLRKQRDDWAAMCGRYKQERDEARAQQASACNSTLRLDAINFKLRKELDDARTKIKSQADRLRILEGATNHAEGTPLSIALKERDEAREQNVKLRDIADTAIEYVGHTSVQQKLRSELKQKSDELHRMSVIEMMDYNLNVKHHVEEWENRCIKAERERDEARDELNKILKNE